jgi:Secretion system C-terminal sorting domain
MRFRPLFALLFLLILPTIASAQWATTGTTVSAMPYDQRFPTICSDGAGGAIMAWEDTRTDGGAARVYAQRINAAGVPVWTANGIALCNTNPGSQWGPRAISDAAGGAIITWADYRNGGAGDIYAQRVNASGTSLWTVNGVAVCNAAQDQSGPAIMADASGNAIIAWTDARGPNPPNGTDIYVQKLNSAGVPQWTANGVAVCTAVQDQLYAQLATDGASGAIIAWRDYRAGTAPLTTDQYAQRVLSNGTLSWVANGVAVCTAANMQDAEQIISDGANGAIIAWQDNRSGNYDVYAQRLSGSGVALWTANGFGVCTMTGDQFGVSLSPDGNQGAFIAWMDGRTALYNNDIYIQHMGGPGISLWTAQGVALAATSNYEQEVQLTTDGANGVIAVWTDNRDGAQSELYTQRLTNNGSALWASGVRVTTNSAYENAPTAIADGSGNVIVGWYAGQLFQDTNVYATRIDGRFGYWGKPEPTLSAAKDVPNDQGGKVRLEWYASSRDQLTQQTITKYTIWRGIDQAMYANAVAAGVQEMNATDPASSFSGKAVRHERLQALDYFWELIGTQTAAYRSAYSFTAATSFDSTATNSATHRFQILAHTYSDLVNWPSNILTGRSVDNLAPPPPLFLTAQRIGNNVNLRWNGVHAPDLDKYTVYRATSAGVTPIAADFLSDNPDTLLTDASAPTSAVYYIVTATDVHQNQSLKSNEASVAATTNTGNLPPIAALTVLQNHPNPFTGETQLQVGLPSRGDVRVDIYDVAGRRVRTALMPARAKGWNTLRLTDVDDRGAVLPSGVYFYKVHAGAETVTKKMVVTH